ncbi:DNA repair protein RecO [Niabella insulamsoli]|uniref:DNA repair protein RecO n=1 Tax=Niabella insulamsoli TaxID=3144874 RepID=UPI0031FC14B6
MSDTLHHTKGIVLRTVKYGDTSLIANIYTELFGLQSYILNGVRAAGKKGGSRIGFFQPGVLLDMEVYHNELKQINRIKEYKFSFIYKEILNDVFKNGVASYMVELLAKCLKLPEANYGLFGFVEDCFIALDGCPDNIMANFPIFFAVQLSHFFGFQPQGMARVSQKENEIFFDIEEGRFTSDPVYHHLYLEDQHAIVLAELLQARVPAELAEIHANAESRRKILDAMEIYYGLHLQDFGKMKTLPILKEILR